MTLYRTAKIKGEPDELMHAESRRSRAQARKLTDLELCILCRSDRRKVNRRFLYGGI
jgi:hypothetical protein